MVTARKARPKSIDEYTAAAPKEARKKLREMRECIRTCAPGADEGLQRRMPMFSYEGILVAFTANKSHIEFYSTPQAVKAFAKELPKFCHGDRIDPVSARGGATTALIRKITAFRVRDSRERDAKWKT